MIILGKALSRRRMLRGVGATLALPFLDSMVPALAARQRAQAMSPRRFGVVYVPNGIRMEHWTPTSEGPNYEVTPILKPLAPFRDRLTIVTGLTNATGPQSTAVHARASTKFLTNMPPRFAQGGHPSAGMSLDQVIAREFGRQTQLASLELALESSESGTCDVGLSCAYTNTIAWRSDTTPLPMEYNPRAVFERMFGDSGTTSPAARRAQVASDRSILDSVTRGLTALGREVGAHDRARLDEYFGAIRDVERRIQLAETQTDLDLPTMEQPVGVPATFQEHARVMFDLQVLAFQADLTRVTTFMLGKEYSGRSYPEVGAPESHHPTSHHQNDPLKLERVTRINTYHAEQFAYFLDRLKTTREGDHTLLDSCLVVYGAGMSDGNSHSPVNLPVLLAGGGGSTRTGGQHRRYPDGTPLANLHISILGKLGISAEAVQHSTGALSELAL